jgi:hypothetical protein
MKFQVGKFTCEMSLGGDGSVQTRWFRRNGRETEAPHYLDAAERRQYRASRDAFLRRAGKLPARLGPRAGSTWGTLRRLAPALLVASKPMTIVVLSLALLGCESAQEIAAREAAERARVAAALDRECRSWGVAPGSAGYVQCRAELLRARTAAEIANQQADAAMWAEWGRNVDAMKSPPPRQPLNCTSMPIGNSVQTNCY